MEGHGRPWKVMEPSRMFHGILSEIVYNKLIHSSKDKEPPANLWDPQPEDYTPITPTPTPSPIPPHLYPLSPLISPLIPLLSLRTVWLSDR